MTNMDAGAVLSDMGMVETDKKKEQAIYRACMALMIVNDTSVDLMEEYIDQQSKEFYDKLRGLFEEVQKQTEGETK